MSKHVKHVPKHRAAPPRHTLAKAPRKALRTTLLLSSVAVAATARPSPADWSVATIPLP